MAHAVAEEPQSHMGLPLPNGKLAMWMFLVTEIMFFTALIGTYMILRNGQPIATVMPALARAARRAPDECDRRRQHVRADLLQLDRRAGPLGPAPAARSKKATLYIGVTLASAASSSASRRMNTRPSSSTTSCRAGSSRNSTGRSGVRFMYEVEKELKEIGENFTPEDAEQTKAKEECARTARGHQGHQAIRSVPRRSTNASSAPSMSSKSTSPKAARQRNQGHPGI